MHRFLKSTTFASDIIKNQRTIFETSGTRLLDALCDVNTDEKNDVSKEKIIPSDSEHRN